MVARYKRMAVLIAIAPMAPAMAQIARGPLPLENPILWIDASDYPPAAMRAGQSGVVRALLDIDVSGRVTGCTIGQSSGSPILDATTCRLFVQRGRFDPASDPIGRRMAGHYTLPVKWVIPGAPGSRAGEATIDYIAPAKCWVSIGGASRRLKVPVCSALIQGVLATHRTELPGHVPFAATEDMLDPM